MRREPGVSPAGQADEGPALERARHDLHVHVHALVLGNGDRETLEQRSQHNLRKRKHSGWK